MKKTKKAKKIETLDERIRDYISADAESLRARKLKTKLIINFPRRRKVPWLSQLSLAIIRWQGGILDMRFFNVREQ